MNTMNEVFSCKMCGYCCHGETTVSLNREDQLRMLEHLRISREEALEKFWRQTGSVVQMKVVNGHCVFYDNGCSIHQARPFRCREWPLVQAILHDASTLETLRSSCPGIGKDASYEDVCSRMKDGGCLNPDPGTTLGE